MVESRVRPFYNQLATSRFHVSERIGGLNRYYSERGASFPKKKMKFVLRRLIVSRGFLVCN